MQLLDHLLPPPARFSLFGRRAPAALGKPLRPPEPHLERLFLHVRSVSADGFEHLFQFALVDDAGNVTVSVFARARTAVDAPDLDAYAAVSPIPAIPWSELDAALRPARGAALVAFGRVLHGSFLPPKVREAAAGLDCARARFVKIARRAGIRLGPGDVADLNDARGLVGLPPVRSPDAALRALGLRELWRWMDAQDQAAGLALSQNRGARS